MSLKLKTNAILVYVFYFYILNIVFMSHDFLWGILVQCQPTLSIAVRCGVQIFSVYRVPCCIVNGNGIFGCLDCHIYLVQR